MENEVQNDEVSRLQSHVTTVIGEKKQAQDKAKELEQQLSDLTAKSESIFNAFAKHMSDSAIKTVLTDAKVMPAAHVAIGEAVKANLTVKADESGMPTLFWGDGSDSMTIEEVTKSVANDENNKPFMFGSFTNEGVTEVTTMPTGKEKAAPQVQFGLGAQFK